MRPAFCSVSTPRVRSPVSLLRTWQAIEPTNHLCPSAGITLAFLTGYRTMRIILSIAVAAILGGAAWPSGATAQNASVTTKAPPGTAPAAGVTVAAQGGR